MLRLSEGNDASINAERKQHRTLLCAKIQIDYGISKKSGRIFMGNGMKWPLMLYPWFLNSLEWVLVFYSTPPLARIPPLRGRGELKEPLCSYVIMSKNVLMSKLKNREIRIKCSVFIHVNLAVKMQIKRLWILSFLLFWNIEFWKHFPKPMVLGSNTYGFRLQKHRF